MHDPTEGGLATALSEVSAASNTGMLINRDNVPILPEAAELCDALSVDPWGLIASGALLITAAPDSAAGVIDAVTGTGSPAVDIGEVRPAEDGLKLVSGGQELPFPIFERDEIARVLGA
jgi:hydrogenase maturation factor